MGTVCRMDCGAAEAGPGGLSRVEEVRQGERSV